MELECKMKPTGNQWAAGHSCDLLLRGSPMLMHVVQPSISHNRLGLDPWAANLQAALKSFIQMEQAHPLQFPLLGISTWERSHSDSW